MDDLRLFFDTGSHAFQVGFKPLILSLPPRAGINRGVPPSKGWDGVYSVHTKPFMCVCYVFIVWAVYLHLLQNIIYLKIAIQY